LTCLFPFNEHHDPYTAARPLQLGNFTHPRRQTITEEQPLIHLIYASSATRLMSSDELTELLKKSRENNAKREITGMLLYRNGNFVQVLEGPESEVNAVYEIIKKDPRHHDVTLILKRPIEKRDFGEWEMGFNGVQDKDIAGYSNFLDVMENPKANPSLAYEFLLTFKEGMR